MNAQLYSYIYILNVLSFTHCTTALCQDHLDQFICIPHIIYCKYLIYSQFYSSTAQTRPKLHPNSIYARFEDTSCNPRQPINSRGRYTTKSWVIQKYAFRLLCPKRCLLDAAKHTNIFLFSLYALLSILSTWSKIHKYIH